MDTNKPLLSALFFIGLSFCGVQFAQAATAETVQTPLSAYKTVVLDMPGSFGEQAIVALSHFSWLEHASTILDRVKIFLLDSFEWATSGFYGLVSLIVQTSIFGLLGHVLEPLVSHTKTGVLKAALPGAVWFFLGGMLGVLGLKKRNSEMRVKV